MPVGVSAYVALANVTLGSSASQVVFSSISQSFRDLVIVGAGFTSTPAGIIAQFNGDGGNNYSSVVMFGDGGSASSGSNSNVTVMQFGRFDNSTLANFVTNIMDYSATDKHKTVLSRYNSAAVLTAANANRYASNSAITSVRLLPESGTFSTGTTLALYGIAS